jgi:DNA repair protein RadC
VKAERPVDRLWRDGPRALSDAELLAVLLQPGGRSSATLDRATQLIEQAGGWSDLLQVDPELGQKTRNETAERATILAIREVAVRICRTQLVDRDLFDEPANVARYLTLRYSIADQEVLGALYLDTRNRLLAEREIFRGTMKRMSVETRQVVKSALRFNAVGIILFHSHPSGDPAPSFEDLAFTHRLTEACGLLDLSLVDHLILGELGRWVSLRRLGHL